MYERKISRLLMGILLAMFISGCAFGTRRPVLSYQIGTASQPQKNINIYIADFKDERTENNVIGHVRNAYGMKTANIVTNTNIANWVRNALKSELANIGYTVIEDPNTNIKVTGEVIEVYVTSMINYEGKVVIEVNLNIDEKNVFTRKYSGIDESISFAMTAKSYGITLERSLQRAVVEAIHDVDKAISNRK